MNAWIFLTFCAVLSSKIDISTQIPTCSYGSDEVFIFITMHSYKSCQISFDDSEELENIPENSKQADDNVQFLKISSNSKILELSSNFFNKFPKLEAIKIENSKIETIDEESLQNCVDLKFLHLIGNEIDEVPENLVSENIKLVDIEISFNNIRTLAEDTFEMQENLKVLRLRNNKIESLPDWIFVAQNKLEWLSLNNNEIEELNPKWFKNLENLNKLILGSNKIYNLPLGVFSNLKKLILLDLSSNYLTEIHGSSFGSKPNLQLLNLTFNQISAIDPNVIRNSPIHFLDMNKNYCFDENINVRDSSMDTHLKRCYENFKRILTTTTTEPPETTTTEPPETTTAESPETTTTEPPETTTTEPPETTTAEPPETTTQTITPKTTRSGRGFQFTTTEITSTTTKEKIELSSTRPNLITTTTTTTVTTTTPRMFENIVESTEDQVNTRMCGKVHFGIPNTVNGAEYARGLYPWIVAIFRTSGTYHCGGALVSSRKVVTAAKCMYKYENERITKILPRDILVVLGSHNIYERYEVGKDNKAVSTIHIHENFKFESITNDADIAVLILDTTTTFTSYIRPICLIDADPNPLYVNDATVASYGHDQSMKNNPQMTPKIVNAPIHDDLNCYLNNNIFAQISSNRTFCAGEGSGTGVCIEDSGSGLFVNYNDRYYLRGILSSVIGNDDGTCNVNTYALYTDVATFTKWITDLPLHYYNDDFEARLLGMPVWT